MPVFFELRKDVDEEKLVANFGGNSDKEEDVDHLGVDINSVVLHENQDDEKGLEEGQDQNSTDIIL